MERKDNIKILILGGYGSVGYETAKILLKQTTAKIFIAGRNLDKAKSAAEKLSNDLNTSNVTGISIDTSNYSDLVSMFRTVELAVVCIPLTSIGSRIARAAFEANINCVDINGTPEKQEYLESIADDIKKKGLTFISEAGCAPGLPSLLVLHAYRKLGKLKNVSIGSIYRSSKVSYGSAYDLLVELGRSRRIFKNKKWIHSKFSDGKKIDFGKDIGEFQCYPFEFMEMLKLPMDKMGIENLGLYAPGVNPLIDLMFIVYLVTRLYKSKLGLTLGARFSVWTGKFNKPPYLTMLKLDAEAHDGSRIVISVAHKNAYIATAIPLAACILQMLELDSPSRSGMHLMGNFLNSYQFLEDIKELGMDVVINNKLNFNKEKI